MNFSTRTIATLATLATAAAFGATMTHGFAIIGRTAQHRFSRPGLSGPTMTKTTHVFGCPSTLAAVRSPSGADQEVERLKAMAAQLREEAAALERKQARDRAEATGRAFDRFDTDQDGELSLDELKVALEKTYKLEVPADQVERLMDAFDTNGDGRLQKDEFVGIEQFRNRLDAIANEKRQQEVAIRKSAQKEAEVAQLIEAQLDLINDKPPSTTDRLVSALPYLLPLMDGLSFGKYLLTGHEGNPLVGVLALLYTVYNSIPFSGFVAYFGLSALSGSLSVNRLVRYNAQQAVYLDLALFVPGLVATVVGAASAGLGLALPPALGEVSSDAVFVALVAAVGYAATSSLLGATPDRMPFLSERVNRRVPAADTIQFINPATGEPLLKNSDKTAEEDDDKTKDV